MRYFAGIDVSLEASSMCVVDGEGRLVREAKVPSEPEALVAFLDSLGLVFERIGLEAGPLSQWLHAGLGRAGLPVVLIETRHVKAAPGGLCQGDRVGAGRNGSRPRAWPGCYGTRAGRRARRCSRHRDIGAGWFPRPLRPPSHFCYSLVLRTEGCRRAERRSLLRF